MRRGLLQTESNTDDNEKRENQSTKEMKMINELETNLGLLGILKEADQHHHQIGNQIL